VCVSFVYYNLCIVYMSRTSRVHINWAVSPWLPWNFFNVNCWEDRMLVYLFAVVANRARSIFK
jgi:hypothetical protein